MIAGPSASPEYLPLRVAEAEGYFAREGLRVTSRTTRAEPGAAEALAQGQADLAATSLDALLRFGSRGPGARIVFGLTAAPPVALVVSASQTSLVRTLHDLPGTRVGLATPGAPEHAWLGWLLARSGLSIADIWIVSHGPRGLVHAVQTGDVHAALVAAPVAAWLVRGQQAVLLADLRTPAAVENALGVRTLHAAVFARADRTPSERTLAAFARAVLAAERRIARAATPALAARLPARVTGDDFAERHEWSRRLYLENGLVTVAQVQESLALARAHQPLPPTIRLPEPADMLHLTPLRRALAAPAAR